MGYLPQAFGFYPQWTARETLRYIALLRGMVGQKERERRVTEVLQRTTLAAAADRKVGTYSRGMRQAVGIAQVLLGGAPALILDEPTAGLDPEARNKLRGMLVEIGQERPVIWASSLISDAVFADRVLILARSKNCFWGTPVELAAAARPLGTDFLPVPGQDAGSDGTYGPEPLEQGYRAILSRGVSS
jgi:ABC-2 type transport system ATP-binding protein